MYVELDVFDFILTPLTAVYMYVELERVGVGFETSDSHQHVGRIRRFCVGFDTSDSRLHVGRIRLF